MAGTLTVDTIQSDSSYASRINVTSNVAFTSPVNFTGGMQIGGADTTFGGMRNRVINGDMVIDQRNAGASVTLPDGAAGYSFPVDRFACSRTNGATATGQQSTNAPPGFTNSLLITNGTGISAGSTHQGYVLHFIEGLNVADLGWGTANAQPVTLSFWVRSSITGTHSGGLFNSAFNRSYPFTYTINQANTWEKETITIPGDTTGTWLTTNGRGITIGFNNGAGSNYLGTAGAWASSGFYGVTGSVALNSVTGSTWQITGVQLEKGSSATAFEYLHYQQELALCQRYFCKSSSPNVVASHGAAYATTGMFSSGVMNAYSSSQGYGEFQNFPVTMRIEPSAITFINSNLPSSPSVGQWAIYTGGTWYNATPALQSCTTNGFGPGITGSWGAAGPHLMYGAWTASAEI